MNDILILWLSAGVFFFIVEMFTGTLYWLSLSLASFLLAGLVWVTGETTLTIVQAFLLAIASGIFSYFFPKWFSKQKDVGNEYVRSPLDREIGNKFVLKKTKDNAYQISIDGVDYLVDEDSVTEGFAQGKKVILNGHKGTTVKVTLI